MRVYEPYFSPSAAYESDAELAAFGVSTLTTYDALGRVVRTLLPNGAYSRVDYAAWSTTTSSPSDTVLTSVYRTLREGLPVDDAERVAYEHAATHAETPVVTYVDARGVACATLAVGDATAVDASTRQVLDVEGKALALIDARGLEAFTYVRDLRGRVLAQTSADAGPAWARALADAYDRAVWTWDARGFAVERGFDLADRPTTVQVRDGDGGAPMDHQVETYRYSDEDSDRTAAAAVNTLGRLVEVRDGAGATRVMSYDPAGAMRSHERQLRSKMNDTPNWSGTESVDAETLTMAAQTDALGREVWTQLVDGTERRATYERGGSLVSVRMTTPDGALVDAPIVEGLARDAHGRVAAATLGNDCVQTWTYDAQTGRLVAQDAVLGSTVLQGLRLTYDPDGKVVRERDLAQDGAAALVPGAVSARRDHRYDAHGRLVSSTGRVHQALLPHDGPTTAGCIHGARHLSLNNGAALERYTQQFTYDVGGNLSRVQHAGTTASWATDLWVAADSNRSTPALDANGVPVVGPAAMFDAGGNLRELWHLRSIDWSWRGCLARAVTIARPSGPVDDGESYTYGADRVRVRKVAHRLVIGGTSPVVERREVVYLGGGQERVRTYRNDVLVLERWTTHVSDGDRRVAIIDRHTVDTLAHEVDSIGPARVRYHLTTPQGSTALELDETGQLISYEEYLPHGGSAFIAGDNARDVARRDVRYAGKERDRATGLHAYPQRYYAPWLGRWLSPDPIGPEDGLNLYAFVGGDPIGYIDPEGTNGKGIEDPSKADWIWSFDREGSASAPYAWNGSAWEQSHDSAPIETIEIVDTAPTPKQQADYDKRLFSDHTAVISALHQVQESQRHLEVANELASLAIEKWGYGKYRDHLGDLDFVMLTEGVRPGDAARMLGSVESYLAEIGEAKAPSTFANASAGFGNGITFGLIGWANRKAGLDNAYGENSDAFRYGNYGGAAAGLVLSGGLGVAKYGVARTATWIGVGAGTGFGMATLQTGADILDGKGVTWNGYLEHAGISTLYGAYGGMAFGFAGPTARTVLGVAGSGAQLGEGAYQISNGNYARGTLDVGLGGLGGYLMLRSPTASRVGEADLLKIERSAKSPTRARIADEGALASSAFDADAAAVRPSGGLRKSPLLVLDDAEQARLVAEFESLGGDPSMLRFNRGAQTGFVDKTGLINVRGDVNPGWNTNHPRSAMSSRAVLAHEMGHSVRRGTKLAVGEWNDEYRASYWAAKKLPGLTVEERVHLIQDARARADEAGVSTVNNNFIRRILYGH